MNPMGQPTFDVEQQTNGTTDNPLASDHDEESPSRGGGAIATVAAETMLAHADEDPDMEEPEPVGLCENCLKEDQILIASRFGEFCQPCTAHFADAQALAEDV